MRRIYHGNDDVTRLGGGKCHGPPVQGPTRSIDHARPLSPHVQIRSTVVGRLRLVTVVGLLFTLLRITDLTSLLSSLRKILENSYSLSKRGVTVHPKKPKLPYVEKTQVGSVPSSSAGVKYLVGADSRKVVGTRSARDVLLKLLLTSWKTMICSIE
ncbi:hypothetical protein L3X38_011176 [Prunus dulcis]|uniref:Uncharacterized protein n=1 Tax=Prunus dulcis TaxID=3755 RepID=A0AAD4ZES7_PRUDU|nr:hypothetical protein L3X38_011176 [Prunus dulcis]